MLLSRGRTVFIADTTVHELPTSVELADIAIQAAAMARQMGHEPRVGLVSYSTFGNSTHVTSDNIRGAVSLLDSRELDFEYDGEMTVDVAMNMEQMANYPFCRLTGPANVLVVPARHSASISTKLMQEMAGATVIGPILTGIDESIQICSTTSTASDILNMAVLAAAKIGHP